MRPLFDRIDACTACDVPFILVMIALLVGCTIWMRISTMVARNKFIDAQRRAQMTFEELGPASSETQFRIFEALDRWQSWQHRPVADIDKSNPTEVEWHALSLLNALLPNEELRPA